MCVINGGEGDLEALVEHVLVQHCDTYCTCIDLDSLFTNDGSVLSASQLTRTPRGRLCDVLFIIQIIMYNL